MSFWAKQPLVKKEVGKDHQTPALVADKIDAKFEKEVKILEVSDKDIPQVQPAKKAKVQEELKLQLNVINIDLVGYYKRKSSGMLTEEQEAELKENEAKKRKVKAELKRKSMTRRDKKVQRRKEEKIS